MSILVTGGSGLLGSALKLVLGESPEHIFLSSSDYDLTDKKATEMIFKKYQPQIVIHLAARVAGLFCNLSNNAEFFEKNVLMNIHVLSECNKSSSVKKVLSCMSTCIFPDGSTLPLTVDKLHSGLPHQSNSGYSFSKRMIDVQNKILYRPDKPFMGIIPTNLFGPHDNFDIEDGHVIPALIQKCFNAKRDGTTFVIKGSGKALRQFVYSLDAAKVIALLIERYSGKEPVIIAGEEEISIKTAARIIAKAMGFRGTIRFEPQTNEGQMRKTALCSVKSLFPDFTFTPFETAIKETVLWHTSQL